VPNVNLKSEYSYNLDLNVKRKWKKASLEMTSYFSLIDQIIVERDFQISGQDSLFIEGENHRVRANVNLDMGWISGVSVQLKKEFSKEWSLFSNHNLQVGREMTSSISMSELSLSHISPYFGRTGVLFENQKFKFWSSVSYNGLKKYENLSEKEQSDVLNTGQDYNAFVLLDLGFSYRLWDSMKVQVNINNINDQHYIPFTSDVSGAGRSIIISLKGRF
jgi:hemoglobin/transferrin/lactoferrin receptor protein